MKQPSPGRDHWVELDVMRGLAAALMVFNHVAMPPHPDADLGPFDALVFIGSFAPVLFYFLTGLGHGVQSSSRPPGPFSRTLVKCAILFAADACFWMSPDGWIGMDFLGFIALSLLLVDGLRRMRHSEALALALAAGAVLLRYLVDPRLRNGPTDYPATWPPVFATLVRFTMHGLPGFSYALFPWIAYPLLGYAAGKAAGRHRPSLIQNRVRYALLAFLLALPFLAASAFLASRGQTLFRWTSMSVSFFLASLAFLWATMGLVLLAARTSIHPWIALSGERSFAVVPLHYLLRGFFASALGPIVTPASYGRNMIAVLVMSFAGSSIIPGTSKLLRRSSPGRLASFKLAISVGAGVALMTLATTRLIPAVDLSVRCITQFMLCLRLALPRTTLEETPRTPAAASGGDEPSRLGAGRVPADSL